MHERKQLMYDLADGFVALPGGLGTLEELAEVTTWSQLGLHAKPVVLLDVDGFWDPLVAQLDRMVDGWPAQAVEPDADSAGRVARGRYGGARRRPASPRGEVDHARREVNIANKGSLNPRSRWSSARTRVE